MTPEHITIDGNEAVASVAHRTNEVIAIYPITPSSNMGEWADEWSAKGKKNIWGTVPQVTEMQSEGGASGAVHGALQAGALTTTFTASQGLLLMIPNMFKIAGELTSFCMHVSARTVAAHALSIFGDHSDVMACRQTGFAMLASGSVQEAHDFAAIAQLATLRSRVPFLHFFDGFRTSHEVAKIDLIPDEDLLQLLPNDLIEAHRKRALTPDRPMLRGTAQNPDAFFQAREACNRFYTECHTHVAAAMARFEEVVGREYHLVDYVGHPEADRIIVVMGSGAEVTHEAVDWLNAGGAKVGVLKVRLFRPFPLDEFIKALPASVKAIAVLDRTKEPGALGEPIYLDVVTALREAKDTGLSSFAADPKVVGGRYGLSSKEFTPTMVKAVFDELAKPAPKNHFTIGIMDDVTHLSLPYDADLDIEPKDVHRGVFFGLGSDGTVGANKNSIKIIGEETDNHAQGYFVYDSKKAGAITISHLRFGPRKIRSSYLIKQAGFVACHQYEFMDKYDVLGYAAPGGVFLLNSPFGPDEVWDQLAREVQQEIVDKHLRFYVIDAFAVARDTGMGTRINTVMQTCFFAISGVLPRDEAIAQIKKSIEKTYGKRGPEVVRKNFAAVDSTLEHLHQVKVPAAATATRALPPIVADAAPDFVKRVTALMLANKGDLLPVSAFPVDGTWPTATAQWEKRNIAQDIPVWDAAICIQCNKCAMVCPHAAIRAKVYESDLLKDAPATFKGVDFKGNEFKGLKYTIQIAPEDCTGCTLCAVVCPAKDKANPKHKSLDMHPQRPLRDAERENYAFFQNLPEVDRTKVKMDLKGVQFLQPLFEYSGACVGCGETPYVKLLTQLFGDRALIANATGCSSIYGGNLPTTPYTVNAEGRGPAWNNSLFEDNAEFGFGYRLAFDKHDEQARELLRALGGAAGRHPRRRPADGGPVERGRHRRPACARRGAAGEAEGHRPPAGAAARAPGGVSRPQERVDCRRRRLGLRHRLRRTRPCPGDGPRREHPRARHRGVLEHGRPGLEGHAPRGVRPVRDGRQGDGQEGPRHDGDGLRQHLRGARGLRGEGHPDGEGLPGGRGVPGAVDHHRLQPLHRPRLRLGEGPRSAEAAWSSAAPGRCSASTRAAPTAARTRSCSIRQRPRSTFRSSPRTRRGSGSSSRWTRRASRCSSTTRRTGSRGASACMSNWPRWRSRW